MVRVWVNPEKCRLIINGHANSNMPGKDLVCCAASTLAETLSRYLNERMKEGALDTLVDKVKPGSVYISAKPESTSEKQIRAVYDMIKTGYKAIAEEYPQYITIKEE